MRFVVVGPAWPLRGGIAHFTENTVESLRPHGEVHLVTFSRQYPGPLFPGTTQEDRSARHAELSSEPLIDSVNPLTWVGAARRIRELKPDAVVFMWWHPFFGPCYGTMARMLSGVRKVVIAHNVLPHERGPLDGLLSGLCFRAMDRAVVLSKQTQGQMSAFRTPERTTRLFHPRYTFMLEMGGWDRTRARGDLGIALEEPVALFFGYVRAYKGAPDLVKAWAKVPPPAKLIIAGEFYAEKEEVLALIEGHNLHERVILHDAYVPNEEAGKYFHASDALVLPYRRASQSGIGALGIAFRKPLVATRVGGFEELFEAAVDEHDNTLPIGALAEPGNPDELAAKIAKVLATPKETYLPGLERLNELYSWEEFGASLARICQG